MALTIQGATIGVDANGIQALINNLQTHVIDDTISKMNASQGALREKVDAAWVGQSAETFKNNMETDKNTLSTALKDSFEVLKSELFNIANTIGEEDQSLVQSR